ncbi:MAG: hypothetical protein H6754_01750 [Candidatus Omnitrophica bacterium]|nr:hypothetical protein [Candidatus Omnitrophota bacterium]
MSLNVVESFLLRQETVLHALEQLQSLRNNYREARKISGECREKMFYYFRVQDEKFYKSLEDFFAENRPALKMIEFLTLDLKEVKVKTFNFFVKYGVDNPLEQGRNFARDLRVYRQEILHRFRVEESYLLPLLKRMSEESGHWLAGKS